jgi:hypothetical protein
MAKKLKLHMCHACGAKQRNDIAGRFCNDECEKQHASDHADLREQLQNEGFIRNSVSPNLWSKDGVSVSEQQCYERGIDQVLTQHQSVVNNPTVRINRKRK